MISFHGSRTCYILLVFTLRNLISISPIECPRLGYDPSHHCHERGVYSRMNKLIFLSLSIPVLVLLVPNVYASPEPGARERIDCDENGDHSWCNGGRGRDGLPFCDLNIPAQGCYDR